jgi:hypothetical protein
MSDIRYVEEGFLRFWEEKRRFRSASPISAQKERKAPILLVGYARFR